MNTLNQSLDEIDPDIAAALEAERRRQENTLEMIASENHCRMVDTWTSLGSDRSPTRLERS